ncbi:MAG TPA: hypothetical protein VHR45_07175 [Thermoanaerobaculia bacterium]|nr:hypothetical protein [Thermoanaerobaculia bacterium]
MNVLAIHNLKGNEELLARELAMLLGKTVYETRSRVRAPGGGPSVIASFAAEEAARSAAALLQARGFDALLLGDGDLEADEGRFLVRGFELAERTLRLESRRQTLEVAYGDVELLLRGTSIISRRDPEVVKTRKFSPARAVFSGGLILTKAARTTRLRHTEERVGFLHMYAGQLPPLVWREGHLRYSSLGGPLHLSRAANFSRLVSELRVRCPQALYDERLATHAGQAQLLGSSLSPEHHLDVAISVLAQALRGR